MTHITLIRRVSNDQILNYVYHVIFQMLKFKIIIIGCLYKLYCALIFYVKINFESSHFPPCYWKIWSQSGFLLTCQVKFIPINDRINRCGCSGLDSSLDTNIGQVDLCHIFGVLQNHKNETGLKIQLFIEIDTCISPR